MHGVYKAFLDRDRTICSNSTMMPAAEIFSFQSSEDNDNETIVWVEGEFVASLNSSPYLCLFVLVISSYHLILAFPQADEEQYKRKAACCDT